MRGATPYGLRGTALAIPNGTLENPAVRFGRERSGFYRAADGRLGIGIKKFQTVEITQNDVFVRANTDNPVVSPLALARTSAVTTDGHEIAIDIYNSLVPAGRLAAYRAAVGNFGWKLYGSLSGVLVSTPLLTVEPDGDVVAAQDFRATRNLLADQDVLATRDVVATRDVLATNNVVATQALQGASLAISGAGDIGGGFTVNGDMTVDGTLTAGTIAAGVEGGNLEVFNEAGPTSNVTIGRVGNAFGANLHLVNGSAALRAALAGTGASGLLSNTLGDSSVWTDGGRLLLGSHGNAKLILDYASGGIQFMYGATQLGRMTNTGLLGVRTGTVVPEDTVHVLTAGDNFGVSIAAGDPAWKKALWLFNSSSVVTATNTTVLGQAGTATGYLGNPADSSLYTTGAGAGRLILGSHGNAKLILDYASAGIKFMYGGTDLGRITNTGLLGVRTGTALPEDTIHAVTAGDNFGISIAAGSNAWKKALWLFNSATIATATNILTLGQAGTAAGYLGNAADSSLYTTGAGAGRLLLGSHGQTKLILDAASAGLVVQHGGLTQARITTGGFLAVGDHTPQTNLHVKVTGGGHGFFISGESGNSPVVRVLNNHSGAHTAQGMFALALQTGAFGFNSAINDFCIGTDGSSAGQLRLGTNAATRLLIKTGGGVELFQANNTGPGGLTIHRADGSQHGELFTDGNGNLCLYGGNGASRVRLGQSSNRLEPESDNATSLGTASNRWSDVRANNGTFSGTLTVGSLSTGGGALTLSGLTVNGTSNLNGETKLVTIGTVSGGQSINPASGSYYNLGSSGTLFNQMFALGYGKPGGGNGFFDTSDVRAKVASSIRPYERGMAELRAITPKRFRYTGEYDTFADRDFVGFVAQDLQQVLPEMVGTHKRKRTPRSRKEEDILFTDTSDLIYILVNAVKELADRLETLEGKAA